MARAQSLPSTGDYQLPALPREWNQTTIREEVVFTQKPRTLSLSHAMEVPFIPMELLPQWQLNATRWDCRSGEELSSGVYFEEGDILLAKITPCLQNGKQAVVRRIPGGWGYATTEVYAFHPRHLDTDFLAFYLYNTNVRRWLTSKLQGATGRQRLPKDSLASLPVPVPPLTEQRAIAQVLRTVQRAKEATEKTIAAARELKKSLMKHLFTYGPVSCHDADQVSLRETDYGQIPNDWTCCPLDQCATVQTGVAKGRRLNGDDAVTLPYLRVANVQDGYLDLNEMKTLTIRRREVGRYSLQPGDVVLTEGGDFDKLGRGFIWNGEVANCIHQNHIFAVRVHQQVLLPSFLAYLTQSSYGKAYFLSVAHKTTNLACINTSKLKALPTLLPPLDEQRHIIGFLSGIDAKIAVEVAKSSSLHQLFDSLLSNLMTGQLRIHDIEAPELGEVVPCP